MNPDERKLLSETYELAKENNEILRKMRRAARWARGFRIFYWTVIIVLSVGAYYVIQPYVDQLTSVYGTLKTQIDNIHKAAGKIQGQ